MPIKNIFKAVGIGLFIIHLNASAQESKPKNIWDLLLNDVKIKYVYFTNYDTYLPKPKFGNQLKELDGQEITVKGFFLPVDVTGDVFVVSYNPTNMCFFCSASGIETILEINVREDQMSRFKRLKADNYIMVKGTLQLNNKNYEHLIYVLNDVELLQTIK